MFPAGEYPEGMNWGEPSPPLFPWKTKTKLFKKVLNGRDIQKRVMIWETPPKKTSWIRPWYPGFSLSEYGKDFLMVLGFEWFKASPIVVSEESGIQGIEPYVGYSVSVRVRPLWSSDYVTDTVA